MLKGNLSTRPFYNERILALAVAIAAIVGIGLTIFNASAIYRLSGERTKQKAEQERTDAEAARIQAAAKGLEGSLDRANLLMLAGATSEANSLIDQRTFSWTSFFSLVEKTLPLDARLIAVSPRVERGVFKIVMIVNAKRRDDLASFIDALAGTGAFYDLLPSEQQRNDDGTYTATMTASYLAPGVPSRTPAGKGTGRP